MGAKNLHRPERGVRAIVGIMPPFTDCATRLCNLLLALELLLVKQSLLAKNLVAQLLHENTHGARVTADTMHTHMDCKIRRVLLPTYVSILAVAPQRNMTNGVKVTASIMHTNKD